MDDERGWIIPDWSECGVELPRIAHPCMGKFVKGGLWTAPEQGLFSDTKAPKNPSQQLVGADLTGDFPEGALGLAQVFGQ